MVAVYIHWPFCISKCPYCDFNSKVSNTYDQEAWRIAYARELEHYAAELPKEAVTSIYFGGGTPSLMQPLTVDAVLQKIRGLWAVEPNAEITLEANPSSVEIEKFKDFRAAGINRLSLGVQSLNDDILRFFGRAHNAKEARKALGLAVNTFPRFSFDMIYGYRDQSPEEWREQLAEALTLAQGHLSLYQLTLEPQTQFSTRARRGEVLTVSEDTAVKLFELTQEMTQEAGLLAYEISNHARPGQESRHNLTYWHYENYLGIGPGAHGRLHVGDIARPVDAIENHRSPETWMEQVLNKGHGIKIREELNTESAMREAMLMGLRLTEGIDLEAWAAKFAVPLSEFIPQAKAERLIDEGLLSIDNEKLRATAAGLQRLNAVLAYLV